MAIGSDMLEICHARILLTALWPPAVTVLTNWGGRRIHPISAGRGNTAKSNSGLVQEEDGQVLKKALIPGVNSYKIGN